MKKHIMLIFLTLFYLTTAFGQRPAMDISFTAIDSAAYVRLDSIKVMNRTRGGDTSIYWPDTILTISYLGIAKRAADELLFRVCQNYPNPVRQQTTISLYVPDKDLVSITVSDLSGRTVIRQELLLGKGQHSFSLDPGSGTFIFFNACWRGYSSSTKIVNLSPGNTPCSLKYLGGEPAGHHFKSVEVAQDFSFMPGDELLYIGYAGTLQSGMLDSPQESTSITFQFATNIPCPGALTVEYAGQVYNTIQIYSQCWLKENLNVGTMIPVSEEMTENGIIEKYCYSNEPDSCSKYGGLYQWDEMMQYTLQQGTRGICPEGWHIPTDEEWKVLEGAVDSQCGIGDTTWDSWGYRGIDAGTNLRTTSGWQANGNGTDLLGFSALPSGYRYESGYFDHIGNKSFWWTSLEDGIWCSWYRDVSYSYESIYRFGTGKGFGFSVRCIRD